MHLASCLRQAATLSSLGLLLAALPAVAAERELPAPVRAALRQAQIPESALVVRVEPLAPARASPPRLSWRAEEVVNPASLMKLYTTGAALTSLGPAWTWSTPIYTTGPLEGGVLQGDLVIVGRGDPSLTLERIWLLLRQVRARGVREIRGDIVLDGSAFAPGEGDPGDFDGERLRPYNVRPDALLLNFKAVNLSFQPEPARGVARVSADPPLPGLPHEITVPLAAGDCGDWRGALRLDTSDPTRWRLAGAYPAACGEKSWPLAYADARAYNARLLEPMWREVGGALTGRVREGTTPPGAILLTEFASPPLAAVVRDINKYSNNVMAQQLFLSLPLAAPGAEPPATPAAARALVQAEVQQRSGCEPPSVIVDNGSGLSRQSRSSAACLAAWLQALAAEPIWSELESSLPLTGVDGTTRRPGRQWGTALGRAHLKTGSLRDAIGLAGSVLGTSGRRYVLVAVINHPNAQAGRPALDALVQWTADDAAPAREMSRGREPEGARPQ
ncbi:D-alanyl-D-alanine carboxypeptidase/D-alanyl-D-alanine endopeptidase [Rivibacter subsaxonicus]|uniref:D-alanyl-D-alanine carboxypeptidase/D-alanyl-D-alanine-endopeptidase (Penicillin-binding protein 4) n=1 Tax=Rivibacter subsaxonicus TaxID=457575 RepID=A0A4Q7VVB5_9BURK|nr:D-alanyl-D-alanine carboxypeptidase/D-alanyl-D-alanine-endopeptidase [Rivibacter subsaxonicus]RZU00570.1 D-alanyl-D-alanine carboxypeptidase/D-alanyl-D-alanine-endopeptidase (penicillin-binding protein 4) [Rivibacter subsaxonicus]